MEKPWSDFRSKGAWLFYSKSDPNVFIIKVCDVVNKNRPCNQMRV